MLQLLPLLLAAPAATRLNYTEVQQRILGSHPVLARQLEHVFGPGSPITATNTDWSFPASSTAELSRLYRQEAELVTHLAVLGGAGPGGPAAAKWLAGSLWPLGRHFLQGPGLGLVRLQGLYSLPAAHLARGELDSNPAAHSLAVADCEMLAVTAGRLGRLDLLLDWLQTGLELASNSPATRARLQRKLSRWSGRHDRLLAEQGLNVVTEPDWLRLEPGTAVVTRSQPVTSAAPPSLLPDSGLADLMGSNNHTLYFDNPDLPIRLHNLLHRQTRLMTRLCRGESTARPGRCRMLSRQDPHLRLGPALLEELSTLHWNAARVRQQGGGALGG